MGNFIALANRFTACRYFEQAESNNKGLIVKFMDILIVDDEPLARDRLVRLVSSLGHEVVAQAGDGEAALAAINTYDPMLVLLDIEMPGQTGLQVASHIADLETPPAIIFTTAYDQYALDAFDTLAAGYLLKPVEKSQLEQSLEKAQSLNKMQRQLLSEEFKSDSHDASTTDQVIKKRQHIAAQSHRGMELIAVDSIRCFLADHKYVMVVGTQGETLIDGTLKELEREFSDTFVRIHRNALVSIQHIMGLDRDTDGHFSVRLLDVEQSPMVSRRYASKLKALMKAL